MNKPKQGNSKARNVVITGATRGLGRAMAEKFAALGHTVIGCGRSQEGVTKLRHELAKPHRFDVIDVSDDKQVADWANSVLEEFGAPQLILNNAALINRSVALWEVPADEFSDLIDVNIKGVANVIRHFVPAMIEAGTGVIVNFSSGWGRSTSPQVAAYCASKWAIEGMTMALSQELPDGLAVVPLNPGIINTDMLQACWADHAGRFRDARAWSETAVPFLLSLGPKHNGLQCTAP